MCLRTEQPVKQTNNCLVRYGKRHLIGSNMAFYSRTYLDSTLVKISFNGSKPFIMEGKVTLLY